MLKLLVAMLTLWLTAARAHAQEQLPIIDVHLHALAADANGPPPLAICIPLLSHLPPLDPRSNWGDVFIRALKNPSCANPIWSPTTDEELMRQTVEVVERRNIIGVLSGEPERVLRWTAAAPGRFIPSVGFQLGRDRISPEAMRRLFENGRFVALGEVSPQYRGIGPDDPRM